MEDSQILAELRGPFLVLLLVVPILAFAGWHVHDAISSSQQYQRLVRTSQIDRAKVLRFQVDEETGVRGYVATKDPLFLEPYEKAKRSMPSALATLGTSLSALAIGSDYVELQNRRNEVWLNTIAAPLIANPSVTPATRTVNIRGKQIVDDFRNADQQLASRLNDAADNADAGSQRALDSTLAYLVASTIAVVLGAGTFGFMQARTARRAYRAYLQFKNQKQIADELQEAFLNRSLPRSPALALHAMYIPATVETKVGGDWYDAFELPDGRILFSIGDVAGHGLAAAVVMSRARQAILAAALGEYDPARVLQRANEAIMLQDSRMVTAICGYVQPSTLEIVYATAGHPAPIMARAGSPSYFLPQGGVALGLLPNASFQTYVAHAFEGAHVILYTDGVLEYGRDIIEGERRLLQVTERAVLDDDPAQAIERLIFAKHPAVDDVAILTMSFKPGAVKNERLDGDIGENANALDVSSSGDADPSLGRSSHIDDTDADLALAVRRILSSRG
jgi:serine phosphatase RsbU (regulator of sigma subunit)